MLKFCIFLCGFLGTAVAYSKPLAIEGLYHQALGPYISYLEDHDQTLTLEQVRNWDLAWKPHQGEGFNGGFNNSAWWLRLDTINNSDGPLKRLLEIDYAILDHLDIYVVEADTLHHHYQLGDKQAFSQRAIDHRHFVVPLVWQPQQQQQLYIRVASSNSVQVPLSLWQEEHYYSMDTTRSLLEGLFFGTMLVVGLSNLLTYTALRDKSYILYVGYVWSIAGLLACLGGYGFQYFWPQATTWNDQANVVFLCSAAFFSAAFSNAFLEVAKVSALLNKLLSLVMLGAFLLALSSFKLPYRYVAIATMAWGIAAGTLYLLVGMYCWQRKVPAAHYYCLAWTAMLSGGMMLALSKLEILPVNPFTEYGIYLGSGLEVVLLSFALAERINKERTLRYEAQQQALISSQRTNEDLELRVKKRTQELEKMAHQLKALSNTDQLTELNNRRAFDRILAEEWQRNKNHGRFLALILLDIDHFKSVNDTYGHPVGDQCLKEVARIVRKGLRRPSDMACRYGGEEFCIILPETNFDGAYIVAERIREAIARHSINTDSGILNITISLGVNALVPNANSNPQQLINKADEALYAAKQQGRNRTVQAKNLGHYGSKTG